MKDTIHITRGDYVIVEEPNTADTSLAKVLTVHGGTAHVLYEHGCHLPHARHAGDVQRDTIILNLGAKPRKGHVFGVDTTNIYVKTKTHDVAGDVHFFYRPSKEVFDSLWSAFNIVSKKLRKIGMHRLIEDDIHWEVYSSEGGGKYSGMYMRVRGQETPFILLRPEKLAAPQYPYVIAHELGHHLHYTYCSGLPALNAAWLKVFNRSIRVKPVDGETCKRMYNAYMSNDDLTVKALRRELDDEDKVAFSKMLSYIRSNHQLTPDDLDTLKSTNNSQEVKAVWPTQVATKDLQPSVSEYACVNVKELFAEAFAFYLTGIAIPKDVTKLLERTLAYAKTQF